MKILAIETSCDETGIALIEEQKGRINILTNLAASQIETHRPWGGVVPNLAKREHLKNLPVLWHQLSTSQRSQAHAKFADDLDLIAVTNGPGLSPCLWTGINFAQDLAKKLKKSLVGINHLKGHIFVALLEQQISNFQFLISKQISNSPASPRLRRASKPYTLNTIPYPLLALIVSGGHTQLVFSKKLGHYQIIGETRDDAAGEAFDKVAKLLGLGYPGGPEISKIATKGSPSRFNLPRPMLNSKNFDFSFSGLKTAVLYLVKGFYPGGKPLRLTKKNVADLCASFQQAVVDVLVSKTISAARELKPKTIILGGGVAANEHLRETLKKELGHLMSKSVKLILPDQKLTTDNALMIALAALAEYKFLKPKKNLYNLKAEPNLRLDS